MVRRQILPWLVLLIASCGAETGPAQQRGWGNPSSQNYNNGDPNSGGDFPSTGDTTNPPGDTHSPPGDTDNPPGDADNPPGDTDNPPGDTDNQPGDTDNPPGDTDNPPGDTAGATELNPGWIGGACQNLSDCYDSNIAGAMCETTGFPGGFCTQACFSNWTCPDTNYSVSLATMSRCIDADGDPRCAAECDFNKSSTGCRPGYVCVTRSRYANSGTTYPICLPADTGRWPGEPVPGFDIGGACINDGDCEHSVCLDLQ
ncbi:MAG: hypothetical protein V3T05_06195, partial [Myxococcota bacterium]